MKPMKTSPLIAWAALTVAATQLFTAATASAAGYKLADKTGASISEFRDEIVNVKKEADATVAALDKIVTTAATDPRKSFEAFNKAVPKIEDAAKKAKKRAEDMKARGAAYFKDWEKELAAVNNPEIRKLAEERKAKLLATFDSIKGFMEPARDQFNVWLADLKDLQKYLGADLTIGGIDAAKALIGKTKAEGQAVQQSLDKVIAELNTIVATLTPARQKARK
jgi:ribosome-associated translation inhibitor RaiA